jgi:hypothetical protein
MDPSQNSPAAPSPAISSLPSLLAVWHPHALPIVGLLLTLLLGLLYYPGIQYLTSDTQIYTPLIEHSRDPSLLARDPLVFHPHLGLSLYDESVNAIRWLTGCDIYPALLAHQVVFRLLQLLAAYFLALGFGVGRWHSLWIATVVQATGFVSGPSVMVVEYDAVPRGYTLGMGLLAIACVLHGRLWLAGIVAGISLFFQAGVAYPFLACFGLYLLFSRRQEGLLQRMRFLAPVAVALGTLLLIAALKGDQGSARMALVPDWLRELHLLRASYNYPSTWHPAVLWTPVLLGLVALAGGFHLRHTAPPAMRWFLLGIPVIAILSIPFAWFTMEQIGLFLMAQLQPARAVAFMYGLAIPVLLSSAVLTARRGQWARCLGWLVASFSIPFSNQLVFFLGAIGWPSSRFRYLWVLAVALLALLMLWLWKRSRPAAALLLVVVMLSPFVILREVLNINAFATDARNHEVAALSQWAAASTEKDAVFAFPGFGKSNQPGVFRAQALRAVYTDWKSGGQVNFSQDFARLWWQRWNEVMAEPQFDLARAPVYRQLEIDYLVLEPAQAAALAPASSQGSAERDEPASEGKSALRPVYRNDRFVVYRTEDLALASERRYIGSQ